MFAQQADNLAPLLGRDRPVLDDATDQAIRGCPSALQQEDDRKRHLALAKVAAHGLPQRRFFGGVVEQIVDELEGDPEVEPEIEQGALLFGGRLAEHAPDLCTAPKEVPRSYGE